jgi:hypothetical protein
MIEPTLNVCIPLPPGGDLNVLLGRVRQAVAAACNPTIRIFDFGAPEGFLDGAPVGSTTTIQTNEPSGWDAVDVRAVILGLPVKQRNVIQTAIKNGGLIDRDETYAVIKRSPAKRLTGFTKPIEKVMDDLKKNGELGQEAKPLLIPVYRGSGRAKAFRVPDEIVKRLKQTV